MCYTISDPLIMTENMCVRQYSYPCFLEHYFLIGVLINDIANSSRKFSFLMHADDTTIYFNLENFPAINREQEINREPEKFNIWFQLNKLILNVDKTKCMHFHKRRAVPPINISMNNIPIGVLRGGGQGGFGPPPLKLVKV